MRKVGDVYRPVVKILKTKKGKVTKVSFSGNEYILKHPDQYEGGKNANK